jgi:hypothetical protein
LHNKSGLKEDIDMVKGDIINDQQEQAATQQRKLRFTDEGIKTQYSGIFNVGLGAEEVVFMFGNPSIDPNVIRIESKIAVSLKTAKRMAVSLGNLIRRYEAINGTIDIAPGKTEKRKTKEENPIQ